MQGRSQGVNWVHVHRALSLSKKKKTCVYLILTSILRFYFIYAHQMVIILPLIDIVDYTVCKMLKPLSFRGSSPPPPPPPPPPPLGPPRLLVVHFLFQKTWLRSILISRRGDKYS
jgi:hypothetical protein